MKLTTTHIGQKMRQDKWKNGKWFIPQRIAGEDAWGISGSFNEVDIWHDERVITDTVTHGIWEFFDKPEEDPEASLWNKNASRMYPAEREIIRRINK